MKVKLYYTLTVCREIQAHSYEDAETQAWDCVPYPMVGELGVTAADCESVRFYDENGDALAEDFEEEAPRPLDMRHSIRALAEFDRGFDLREQQLDEAMTEAEVREFIIAEQVAVNGVREAFFLDTSDRNSWDNAMAVSVEFVRALCRRFGRVGP